MSNSNNLSLLDKLCETAVSDIDIKFKQSFNSYQKEFILRDLHWLLNCSNHGKNPMVVSNSYINCSCLNYGISPLSGKNVTDIELDDIERSLRYAITHFEPRIIANNLEINFIKNLDELNLFNMIHIEIKGSIYNNPHPIFFSFKTELDLENGHIQLKLDK